MSKGVTRERSGQHLQALLRLLLANPEGLQARVALDRLASQLTLTEHEKGRHEDGSLRFDKMVRFTTVDAVKAGWMIKNKGIWFATDAGRKALEKFPDAGALYREAARLYREWASNRPELPEDTSEATPVLEARVTYEVAEEQAWNEIRAFLEQIDPYELQELVGALLEAMGYHVAWVAPPGKDGGVDLMAWNDPLGTKPPRIKVQVKRRKDATTVESLRSFLALINDDDVGIFVTTGGFTRDAQDLARSQERRKITLVDAVKLVELWIQYNDKLEKDKRGLLPLKPIYFLAPSG